MSRKVNYHHKDRLFCTIFGTEEFKKYTLSLYNALNHTSYTDVEDLELYCMNDVIYMGIKNDVGFLLRRMG